MRGVQVIGYDLVDADGASYFATKEEAERLALTGMVFNCKAQEYEGKIKLTGINGFRLSDLPVVDVVKGTLRNTNNTNVPANLGKLVYRIFDGKNIAGYGVVDSNGNEWQLTREEVMSLARSGYITNARVQKNNGEDVLRGVGIELTQLQTRRLAK